MNRRVAVIGDSPAGLSAALHLHQQGYQVTLYQHRDASLWLQWSRILFGSDRTTLALLQEAGHSRRTLLAHRLTMALVRADRRIVGWPRVPLPSPFHALAGCAIFAGLPLRDRFRLLSWVERTWEKAPALPLDLDSHSAEAWLRGIGQSDAARAQFWTPLSRFLLGDDTRTVSAGSLLTALNERFLPPRREAWATLMADPLDRLLLHPLTARLRQEGVTVIPLAGLRQICFDAHRATGVQLEDGRTITTDWYVLALPFRQLTPLLPERAVTRFSYFQQLTQLRESPRVTVQLSLAGSLVQARAFLFANHLYHSALLAPTQGGHVDVTFHITGSGSGVSAPDDSLIAHGLETLHWLMPRLPAATMTPEVIREDRAFLTVSPGTTARRPLQQSPFGNFFLVGEWTDTGLPPTLESAMLSGNLCAKALTAKLR